MGGFAFFFILKGTENWVHDWDFEGGKEKI